VPRTHDGEVTVIERRELGLAQPLYDSQHGGVDEADAQVGVGFEQLADTRVVDRLESLHQERFPATVLEKPHERVHLIGASQQILELYQHRRGHDPVTTALLQQGCAGLVILVARLDRGEEGACVDD
jgi:hypothetical protein